MLNKNIFSSDLEWNYRTTSLFIFLLALPNLLGMINITTVFGFKIHFFQIAIFYAAILFGPTGGLLSGLIGSFYSAIIMHNPYIMIGNAILGFCVGLFARKHHIIIAVILAFLFQLPWLVLTDFYLVHLPMSFILPLIIALTISNILWASIVHISKDKIKDVLK